MGGSTFSKSRVAGRGSRVAGSELWVLGSGFWVLGSEFRGPALCVSTHESAAAVHPSFITHDSPPFGRVHPNRMIVRCRLAQRVLTGLALAAGTAVAQRPAAPGATGARSVLVMTVRGDTVGIERVARGERALEGELQLRGQPRVSYRLSLDAPGRPFNLAVAVRAEGASDGAAPVQVTFVRRAGDSLAIDVAVGGAPPVTRRIAAPPDAMLALGNSLALLATVVERARVLQPDAAGATVTVPVFLAADGPLVESQVQLVTADSAVFTIGQTEVHLATRDGQVIRASVPLQQLTVTRVDGAAAEQLTLASSRYAAPADAPYSAVAVSVPAADGSRRAGTLTMPRDATGSVPAVVTITGIGAQERDGSLSIVPGYRPFAELADALARRGVAVLRLDDRRLGLPADVASTVTTADLAADAAAAVRWLRARPGIDRSRVVLVGHSEGGVIAPLVAADDPRLAGIVLLSAPGWPGRRLIVEQLRYAASRDRALTPRQRDAVVGARVAELDSAAQTQPWLHWFAAHDPLETAARVQVPALVVAGETDRQAPVAQASELAGALRRGGSPVALRILPGRDHLLLADPDGDPAGYARLPDKRLGATVLGPVVDWIVERLHTGR